VRASLHRPAVWGIVWAAGLALLGVALQRPAPLVLNLGPGDRPFVRGFRDPEREGRRQDGATLFRWSLDGARIELPVRVLGGSLTARLRIGRFTDPPTEVTLWSGGRVVDRWIQERGGWRVRTVELGELRGPLAFQLRSPHDAEGLGVALDWIEVRGAAGAVPTSAAGLGLAALLLGVPLLVGLGRGALPALVTAAGLAGLAAAAVGLDRLGGLIALSHAGGPAVVLAGLLALAAPRLARRRREPLAPAAALAALAAAVVALVALCHPGFYYPDVDTHAGFLAALRADPWLAWDPAPFQLKEGTWTRRIGERRVAFPYSPAFHLLAWPPALLFGEPRAIALVATLALGLTLILAHALALRLGLAAAEALLAQVLLALLPVSATRLCLALYPTLLGQALDLLVWLAVARGLGAPDPARSVLASAPLVCLALLAYTGSLFNVPAALGLLCVACWVQGERRRALALLAALGIGLAAAALLLYGRFVPTLLRDVLPHAGEPPAEAAPGGVIAAALQRLRLFYDCVYPLLAGLGLAALRARPGAARRMLLAVLAAGAGLLLLRGAVPALFRDAKEVELLAAPVAVLAAAGAGWLWRRGAAGRAAAAAGVGWALAWGALRAAHAYGERFFARGL